jgi:hypothetical protein
VGELQSKTGQFHPNDKIWLLTNANSTRFECFRASHSSVDIRCKDCRVQTIYKESVEAGKHSQKLTFAVVGQFETFLFTLELVKDDNRAEHLLLVDTGIVRDCQKRQTRRRKEGKQN